MKLLITTQVYENYAWLEDGTLGIGKDAYWKPKGGDEYVIKNIKNDEEATVAVMSVRDQIERASNVFMESIVDYHLVPDNYMTEYERSQLEYEGRIQYPAKEIVWN